jgi:hypothetical protein
MKSLVVVLFTLVLALVVVSKATKWDRADVLIWDVAGYYQYLPSQFIYHDQGNGTYTAYARQQYRPELDNRYVLIAAPNGGHVVKYPLGMSLFYALPFAVAHGIAMAGATSMPDGFSSTYQYAIQIGGLLWALLGLWVLRGVLRRYFDDLTTAATLLAIGLGTNFFCYASYDAPMSHGTLFMLNAMLLALTGRWLTHFRWGDALGLGVVIGLLTLVRFTEAWNVLVPALWGLTSMAALRGRARNLWQHKGQVVLAAGVAGTLLLSQLLYWRYYGGAWHIDTYPNEHFDFAHPHLREGLFSIRKGWLTYSPLMGLALLGIMALRGRARASLPVLLTLLPMVLWVTYSWWDWGYGGSFGARPLISIYPLLSLPLAALLERAFRQRWTGALLGMLLFLGVALNQLQTWQYYRGILHCCDMTATWYHERFFWLDWPTAKPGS